ARPRDGPRPRRGGRFGSGPPPMVEPATDCPGSTGCPGGSARRRSARLTADVDVAASAPDLDVVPADDAAGHVLPAIPPVATRRSGIPLTTRRSGLSALVASLHDP